MILLESELQGLSELYSRLSAELSPVTEGDSTAAVEATLRNKELFERIERMNTRLVQLVQEWKAISPSLDPDSRQRARSLARRALEEAIRLSRLCEERLAMIESYREKIGLQLGEINRGFNFLSSIKPLKGNFPKFIDSQG